MDDQEQPIRDAVRQRDLGGAATTALKLYGSELFGYALWLARTERHAEIGYWDAEERVRGELEYFEWTVSVRAWGHSVVRESVRTFEAKHPS
jgi:hypothetical protein